MNNSDINAESGQCTYVTYSGKERDIVKSGISAIEAVLWGNDMDSKRRLLLCLDYYMDPYFGQDISDMEDTLVGVLQTVIIGDNDYDVKEDALLRLLDYTHGPYHILERNMDKIEPALLPDVKYLIEIYG